MTVLTGLNVVLVAAVAENGVIGRDNNIPWKLKADLQRFKAITLGRPIVMGRKTYESLGRPLPGRTNIVLTRDASYQARGAVVVTSLEDAVAIARADAARRGVDDIMVIGGGEIYRLFMPQATKLELTEVQCSPDGDALFPEIQHSHWNEVAREPQAISPDDTSAYSYVTYCRA